MLELMLLEQRWLEQLELVLVQQLPCLLVLYQLQFLPRLKLLELLLLVLLALLQLEQASLEPVPP